MKTEALLRQGGSDSTPEREVLLACRFDGDAVKVRFEDAMMRPVLLQEQKVRLERRMERSGALQE